MTRTVNVVDTTAPTLAEVTPVTASTNDTTPDYTFSSNEGGAITYGGDCSSSTTTASVGNNTISFNSLAEGAHTNCTITVTDASSNVSTALNISGFTVDTTAPTLSTANINSSTLTLTYNENLNG